MSGRKIGTREAAWIAAHPESELPPTAEARARTAQRLAERERQEADEARWAPALRLYRDLMSGTTEDADAAIEIVMGRFSDVDGLNDRLDYEATRS